MARRSSNGGNTSGGVGGAGSHMARTVIGGAEPYIDNVQPTTVGYKPLKYDDATGLLHSHIDDSQNASSSTLPTISGTLGQSPQYHGGGNTLSQTLGKQSHTVHQLSHPTGRYFYPQGGHSAPGLGAHHHPHTQSHGHYGSNLAHATNTGTGSRSKSFAGRVFTDFMNSATGSHRQNEHLKRTSPAEITASPTSGPPSPPSASDDSLLPPPCSESLCVGIRELLASLGLMCILSLLMAFLALFFLHKSCPVPNFVEETTVQTLSANNSSKTYRTFNSNSYSTPNAPQRLVSNAKEYNRVYQISVSLSTLTIALDLCCLFVSCVQFLAIVKLIKNPYGKRR